MVVVGGSIDLYHPIYLQKALEKAARYMPAPDSLHIEKAVFGDDADSSAPRSSLQAGLSTKSR